MKHHMVVELLSLCSTATQNHAHLVLVLATDNATILSKDAKMCVTPNTNAKIYVTPNANLQRQQVEYRWCWVPNARGLRWPFRFHVVCVHFIHVG